ncbi:carboxypeptidase-like regulatory domain-containing protein [Flavobacterium anhuiense]|uniref:carboxypeptidase-like regulatory domain-containing protein n=1 Tax=Flavobacterium anhuiense TaxID=459526 RepID=UPI0028C40C2D|nr:carboxypeptidase-like regulatory domain-containing protein [Flavobacterium anhuiense]
MKKLSKFLLLLLAFIYAGDIYAQGNTTSSINGVVYDSQNKSLPGATILAVHEASGSRYSTTTDFDGHFRISNMRVGGPYKIEVTFIGYTTYTESGVYLQLGDAKSVKAVLKDETNQLSEVVVVGKKIQLLTLKRLELKLLLITTRSMNYHLYQETLLTLQDLHHKHNYVGMM